MKLTLGAVLMMMAAASGCENQVAFIDDDVAEDADAKDDPGLQGDVDAADRAEDVALSDPLDDSAVVFAVAAAPDAKCKDPSSNDLKGCIEASWEGSRAYLTSYVKDTLKANAQGAMPLDHQRLYGLQRLTANILLYAHDQQDSKILSELAQIFQLAKPGFVLDSTYQFTHVPNSPATVAGRSTIAFGAAVANRPLPIARAYYWKNNTVGNWAVGFENTLSSAQFMYAVSRLIRATAELPAIERPAALTTFVSQMLPLARDSHYRRWVLGRPEDLGAFNSPDTAHCGAGKFTHAVLVDHLLNKRFGNAKSFCNMVVDRDLWIASGVAELVMAAKADPALVNLNDPTNQYGSYVVKAARLFKQRTTPVPTNEVALPPSPSDSPSALPARTNQGFELGAWDHHIDYAYMGYEGTTKPLAPSPTTQTAWDIYHARRWVSVFDTFRAFSTAGITRFEWPTQEEVAGFAREFAFKVPEIVTENGKSVIKFKSMMNGDNGWYRFNPTACTVPPAAAVACWKATDKPNAKPFGRSDLAAPSGFAFWASYEPEAGEVIHRWITENPTLVDTYLEQLEILPSLSPLPGI